MLRLFWSFSIFAALPCFAQANLTQVTQGAATREVIVLLGDPTERIERETKREVVWYYPTGSIVFSKGRAKSIFIDGSTHDRFSEDYLKFTQPLKPVSASSLSSPVEDILSEILREVPSETGPDTASGTAPVAAGEIKPLDVGR